MNLMTDTDALREALMAIVGPEQYRMGLGRLVRMARNARKKNVPSFRNYTPDTLLAGDLYYLEGLLEAIQRARTVVFHVPDDSLETFLEECEEEEERLVAENESADSLD